MFQNITEILVHTGTGVSTVFAWVDGLDDTAGGARGAEEVGATSNLARRDSTGPPVSEARLDRLVRQAMAQVEVLQRGRDRDLPTLSELQDALDASKDPHATESKVTRQAREEVVWAHVGETSTIRSRFSLQGIAETVLVSMDLGCPPTTNASWASRVSNAGSLREA